jgi:hypothetical protein
MSDQIQNWIRRAKKLADTIRDSTQEFRNLSQTYVSIHDVAKNDHNAQESADMAYAKLLDDRTELCSQQAGGARRRFRKTRRVFSPIPHPPRRHRRTHRGKN